MAEPLPQHSPTSQESQGDYLSVAQVAQRLGCSVSLVQKWRRLGWLPATRLGPPDVPVYGYHPSDVERFARERWNRRRGRPRKVASRVAQATAVPRVQAPDLRPSPGRPAPPPVAAAARHQPPSSLPSPTPSPTRPLVLWDGDPSTGTALVLARFPAGQVDEALRVAAMWARRYGSLALAEAALPGESPHVLARWQDGVQVGG